MSFPARVIDDMVDLTDDDWLMSGKHATLDPADMANNAMQLLDGLDTPEAVRIRARWRLVLDILQKGIAGV